MLYIVVALKAEAQAFVDKYKLTKSKLNHFILYNNSDIHLIISGMGVENSRKATQTLINHFDISDDDIYLNVGICAASNSYKIGELVEIGNIHYKEIEYTLKQNKKTITCVDQEQTSSLHAIVDMESYGFYDATKHNPAIQNIFIFKVVSDHFEPKKVTKEYAKKLLFQKLESINNILSQKEKI